MFPALPLWREGEIDMGDVIFSMPVVRARLVEPPRGVLAAMIHKLPPLDMDWAPEVREAWFRCWLRLGAMVSDPLTHDLGSAPGA